MDPMILKIKIIMVPWKIMNMGPPQNILPLRGSFSTDPLDCEVQHQQKLISFESQKDPKLAAVGNLHLHARLFSCFVDLKNNFLIFFTVYTFFAFANKKSESITYHYNFLRRLLCIRLPFLLVMVHGTVDGRNPAPVDVENIHLQGFLHPRWLFGISSINSIMAELPWSAVPPFS